MNCHTKKTAAVFCSARNINPEEYELGSFTWHLVNTLRRSGYNIIYGGGYQGLMGQVANDDENFGVKITGISTYHLLDLEVSDYDKGNTHFVQTMGERKQIQLQIADVVLILPGGFGTLDELFEALTFNQLGISNNKIIIMDLDLIPILKELTKIYLKRGTISQKDADRLIYIKDFVDLEEELNNEQG